GVLPRAVELTNQPMLWPIEVNVPDGAASTPQSHLQLWLGDSRTMHTHSAHGLTRTVRERVSEVDHFAGFHNAITVGHRSEFMQEVLTGKHRFRYSVDGVRGAPQCCIAKGNGSLEAEGACEV